MQNFHDLFFVAFKRWVELIKQKVDTKIERCFDNEKHDVLTELTKFSSSSVEVSNCFNQVLNFWKLINWPDSFGADILFNELIESLSRAIIRYANLVKESNQSIINPPAPIHTSTNMDEQMNNSLCISKPLDNYQKLLIATNNIERVRESLKAFLTEVETQRQNQGNSNASAPITSDRQKLIETNRALFENFISETNEYLIQTIEHSLNIIVNTKIIVDLQSHMFYLFESPESTPPQESISRIVKYLDENLMTYKELSYKTNFERFLKLIWVRLVAEIETNLKKDDTVFKINLDFVIILGFP
jgi:predicted component of type VI protein secretion system